MQIGYKLYENLKLKVSPSEYSRTFSGSETINEVLNFVNARYVDTINRKDLNEMVIRETLSQLDPHSSYITSDEIEDVNESLQGNFDGIGIEFSVVKDSIFVISIIEEGPADKSGLLPGDKIVVINDSLVAREGLTTTEVISLLKGEKGTSVKVGIKRDGFSDLQDIVINRGKIPLVSLDAAYMLEDNIGFIKLSRFSATTYNEFGEALISLQEQGMEKLILDLRQNPGGYLDAATKIADEIIGGKNLLVYTKGKNYNRKDYFSKKFGAFEEGEVVVLIDQGSASASEILAGAVQDLDRGMVVGRRSYGKGLVQEQHSLSDGSALRLTVARYYTPSGRSIQKHYDTGDQEEYNEELSDRYFSGELFNQDSIKINDTIEYTTKKGRVVFGGGGITPDIFVPVDSSKLSSTFLQARSYIPPFAYYHFSQNQTEYLKMKDFDSFKSNFKIEGKILEEFYGFLASEKAEFNIQDLSENLPQVKNYIKAYIARHIWKNNGFFNILGEDDEILAKGIIEAKKLNKEHLTELR